MLMARPAGSFADQRLTPLDEQRIIQAARKGCADSARRLIESHQERLFAFVRRMIRDVHDAEEICQDAFLRAFQSLDTFDPTYRFSTWLFTIAYRLCLNVMRRRRDYSGETELSLIESGAAPGREHEEDDAAEIVANTEEARAIRETVWEAVDRLSAPQRATVLLFYRESLGCQEIGEILSIPAATVKSHLHRARSRLKELLSDRVASDWNGAGFFRLAANG